MPLAAPGRAPTALVVVDATSAAGGLRVGPGRGRRLLLRPAEVLRLRRRPVARGVLAGRGRAHRAHRRPSDRWMPGRRSTSRSRSRTAASTRPTTRRRWPRCSCSISSCSGCTTTAASSGRRVALRRVGRRSSTAGPRRRRTRRRSSPIPAQRVSVVGTIDLDAASTPPTVSRSAARQRHRRHRLVPQARPQPAAHRHVPGDRPATSRRSPTASTTSSNAWLEFLVFLTHRR